METKINEEDKERLSKLYWRFVSTGESLAGKIEELYNKSTSETTKTQLLKIIFDKILPDKIEDVMSGKKPSDVELTERILNAIDKQVRKPSEGTTTGDTKDLT